MSEPVLRRTRFDVGMEPVAASTASRLLPLSKVCALLALLAGLSLPALVQAEAVAPVKPGYAVPSERAVHSLLVDVVRAGKRLVAVGDRGHILFSDDQGQNWQQAEVPTRQMLTGVFFVDDQHGWAVGHDAQILASRDGGQTWQRQYRDLEREAPLLDVWFRNRQQGFAVGAYGAVLTTNNGGQTWEEISERLDNPDAYHLNGVTYVEGGGLFVVGELGLMYRSADWGLSWETVASPYEGSLFGVGATGQPGSLVVYGLRGHLFRSSDFGNSWQAIRLEAENGPLEFGLAGSALLEDGQLVVVGHGGSVLLSRDAGQSFTVINRADRLPLAGVASAGNGGLILVGQGGVHLATANGSELDQQ